MARSFASFAVVGLASCLGLPAARTFADEAPPPAAPAPNPPAFAPPTDGPGASIAAELAAIHTEADPAKQRVAIAALVKASRDAFFASEPGVLAALAPDVLRVYDLAGALASGGDGERPAWWAFPDVPDAFDAWPPPADVRTAAVVRRARRIAGAVAARVKPPTIAAPTFVDVRVPSPERHAPSLAHACVVVLGGPDDLARAEAALDRVATTGGPSHVVTIDVLRSATLARALGAADLAPGTARDATGLALPTPAARAAARVASFSLPTPFGRRSTAFRSVERAYVKDVEVEVPPGNVAAPVLGALREGLGASALAERGPDGTTQVTVEVRWLDAPRPLRTFATSLASGPIAFPRVVIEIPTLEVARATATIPTGDATSRHVVRVGPPDTFAIVESLRSSAGTASAPGWARVAPDATSVGIVDARRVDVELEVRDASTAAGFLGGLSMLGAQEVTLATSAADAGPAAGPHGGEVSAWCTAPEADGTRTFDVVVRTGVVDAPPRTFAWTAGQVAHLPVLRTVVRPYRFRLAPGQAATATDADGRPALTLTYRAPPAVPPPERWVGLASPAVAAPARPADAALAAVRAATGPDRAKAILALRDASEAGFLLLTPTELATLAPDVLRVYDVSAALADGDDAEPPPAFSERGRSPLTRAGAPPPLAAGARRARRMAEELARERDTGFAVVRHGTMEGPTSPFPPTALVVCRPDGTFDDVERALDRLATTGGPVVHVEVEVVRTTPDVAAGVAASPVATYAFDVAHNRTRAAWRHVRHAYVEDAAIGPAGGAPRPVAPVVRTWTEGIGLVASVGEGGGGSDPQLHLTLATSSGVEPVPTFTTTLAQGRSPITIELPSLVLRQLETAWLVPAGGLVARETLVEGELAVRVRATRAASTPVGRGWARWTPEAPPATGPATVATLAATWRGADGRALTSPRVTVYLGQAAIVSVVNEQPYVAGVVVTGRGESWIADPELGVLSDGITLEATVHPAPDGDHIVDGRILVTLPDAPLREVRWDFGVGTPMTIQLPVVREVSRPFRARLRVGGSASVPFPAIPGGPTATLTLTLEDVRALDLPAPAAR